MSQSKRILLIEDDAFLREIYTDTLTKAGYVLDTAQDGEEGMRKILAGNWDLLLQDIVLPKIDGLESVRQVKANPAFADQLQKPIVFLTNLDNDNDIAEAQKLGNGYLIKSDMTPGDLVKYVQPYIAVHEAATAAPAGSDEVSAA